TRVHVPVDPHAGRNLVGLPYDGSDAIGYEDTDTRDARRRRYNDADRYGVRARESTMRLTSGTDPHGAPSRQRRRLDRARRGEPTQERPNRRVGGRLRRRDSVVDGRLATSGHRGYGHGHNAVVVNGERAQGR